MEKAAALRQCPLLAEFTDVGVQIIASIAAEKRLPAGTPVFVEGMVGDALYVLVAGRVRFTMKDEAGVEHDVGEAEAPEAFGELALLGAGPRMVSAYAAEPCDLLEIHLRDFGKLQRKKPQACLKLLISIVKRFGDRLGESREAWRSVLISAVTEE